MKYEALAEQIEALAKLNALDPLAARPTYRAGTPEVEGNIDGWMVVEVPPNDDQFATGLSRNGADFVVALVNAAPQIVAALREAGRLEQRLAAGAAAMREVRKLIGQIQGNEDLLIKFAGSMATIADDFKSRAAEAPDDETVKRKPVWPLLHTMLVQFARRIAEADAAPTHDERVRKINAVSAHMAVKLEEYLDAPRAISALTKMEEK